jgi:DNA mismatch repair protein MutS2
MLSELATARAALESEQREAARLRQETEATREEYRRKLERLQERRDKLYHAMRDDLDKSFREAHARIADVIRGLQRGGDAQAAAQARDRLKRLEAEQRAVEQEAGLSPGTDETLEPIDWRTARPGDAVRIAGAGAGTLTTLPDSRGRVAVQTGSARVTVPLERVGRADPAKPPQPSRPPPTIAISRPEAEDADIGEAGRCDLRGLRVDEALDRLLYALDRAASAGRSRLVVVHGIGTGALRGAVREHLRQSRYVSAVEGAPPDQGGDGATIAVLD